MCEEKYPVWGEADDDGEQSNWGGTRSVGLLLSAPYLLFPVESSHETGVRQSCAQSGCALCCGWQWFLLLFSLSWISRDNRLANTK